MLARASWEWRKEIACKGKGSKAAKAAAVEALLSLLRDDAELWALFEEDWADPQRCVCVRIPACEWERGRQKERAREKIVCVRVRACVCVVSEHERGGRWGNADFPLEEWVLFAMKKRGAVILLGASRLAHGRYSVIMQPFLLSPAINTCDIMVALHRAGDDVAFDDAIRAAHPFPLLEVSAHTFLSGTVRLCTTFLHCACC